MVVRLLVQRVLEKDIWTKVGRRKPFFSIPLSPKQRFIFSDIDKQRTSFYFILHADFQWLSAINGDVISLMLGGNYWSTLIKIIPLTAWRISESTTGDCGQQGAWRKHSYKALYLLGVWMLMNLVQTERKHVFSDWMLLVCFQTTLLHDW